MPSADDIRAEMARLDNEDISGKKTSNVVEEVLAEVTDEDDGTNPVDILSYIRASWGLQEEPYPIQCFILKLIYGMPLDDVNPRIEVWDKFRERVLRRYTEKQFLEFLYVDERTNLSIEEHEKRWDPVRKKGQKFNTVVFRLGRRGTKTTMAQWITGYEVYRLLKMRSPQAYYKLRQDQPIRVTLVATGKEQAQELLSPARAAIQRSPYLRRYVESDAQNKIGLTTEAARRAGVKGSVSGISVMASPCSAKSLRGPANILALLEEYGAFFWELQGSNKSDKAIWQALYPSTGDFKDPVTGAQDGMILIISTPLSKESHMYKVEEEIRKGTRSGLILNIPTYWINPNYGTKNLREDYNTDHLSFQQEIEAQYLDDIQGAFTREDIAKVFKPISSLSNTVLPDEITFMGVDLGLKNDGTTISVVAINAEGRYRLVAHELYRTDIGAYEGHAKLPIEKMAERIDHLWNFWSCRGGIYDQWNAYGLESHLKSGARAGLEHVEFNQTMNDRLARHIISVINQENLVIYGEESDWDDPNSLVKELIRLHRFQTSGDPPKIKIVSPNIQGFHDDQYSSLSRALWAAKEGVSDHPILLRGGGSRMAQERSRLMQERRDVMMRRRNNTERSVDNRNPFMRRLRGR